MTQLAKTIEAAKKQLQQMIDLNPEVMLLVNRNSKLMRANKAVLNLLSASGFADLLGKQMTELFDCANEDFFTELLKQEEGAEGRRTEMILPDGRERILQFSVVGAVHDGNLVALTARDVTEEKEQEEHLEKELKIEAAQETIGALQHNINQPLTVIMMRAQLVHLAMEEGEVSSEELKKELRDIMQLTARIGEILRNAEKTKDYVTEPYVEGTNILDIEQAGETGDMEEEQTGKLETLLAVLDVHAPGALVHAEHTSEYAAFLARKMGLDEKETADVRRCAILHDVGKIGIPSNLIHNTDTLTPEEMDVMRKHAEKGYNLLVRCELAKEAEVVYAHHERYDGTGYPRKLAGENIPLAARVMAVADAFDVLRFGRPYQNAVSLEEAVKEIKAGSGAQFDPEVVKAFEQHAKELDKLQPSRP